MDATAVPVVISPAMTMPMMLAYVLPIIAGMIINAWLQHKSNLRTEKAATAAAITSGVSAAASKATSTEIASVKASIEDNTSKTEAAAASAAVAAQQTGVIHGIVNGRTDAMLARIAELEAENKRLKGQQS